MTSSLLVTGANSFIGAALTRRLIQDGDHRVVATYRMNKDALVKPAPTALTYRECNLVDPDSVSTLFREHRFDSVVHLAAARQQAV